MSNNMTSNVRRCLTLIGLLGLWEASARVGWLNPFYLPPPLMVGRVMVTLAAGGELWPHLGATAVAAFAGLLVGLGLGIGLGFAAALSPMVAELLETVQPSLETACSRVEQFSPRTDQLSDRINLAIGSTSLITCTDHLSDQLNFTDHLR